MSRGNRGPQTPADVGQPQTSPTPTAEPSQWILKQLSDLAVAVGRVETQLNSVEDRCIRIESKLDKVKEDVSGHSKWLHTFQVLLGIAGFVFTVFIGQLFIPMVKAKFFK